MKIDLTTRGGCTLAELSGTIDERDEPVFAESLHPVIARTGARLILDMSQVDRITSAGISHLVTLVSRANTKGSRAVLVNPQPFVASVLAVTRLDKFFEIVPSVEQALRELGVASESVTERSPTNYEHLECAVTDGVLVLIVTARELRDYEVTTAMAKEMEDAYARSGATHVAVDLSHIEFLASPGYLPFLAINRKARSNGGRMAVFNLKPFIRDVFTTTRLLINPKSPSAPFEFAADLPEAIAKVTGGSAT